MLLKKKHTRTINSALLVLLSLVFSFNTAKESFHLLFEHREEVHTSCAAETESDDCHLFIVHHIKSVNCDGSHDHFLKKETKCFTCDYYKNKQVSFSQLKAETFIPIIGDNTLQPFNRYHPHGFSFSCFLRGPPQLS